MQYPVATHSQTYSTLLKAGVKFSLISMEMNQENMQVSMKIQTNYRSSCSQVAKGIIVTQILDNSQGNDLSGILFQGSYRLHLAILLEQAAITGVFRKIFQNFRTAIFMYHLWTATSEYADQYHGCYPSCLCHF